MSRQTQSPLPRAGAGFSAAGPALYRVLLIVLVLAILLTGAFVVRALLAKSNVDRGPRSLAEKNILDTEAAVKKDPRSANARLELGKAYAVVGRYGPAIAQLRLAERLDGTKAEVPYVMGAVYHKRGDYANAVAYLEKATAAKDELGKFYADANYELGQTHYDAEEYKKAVKAYETALGTSPLASDIMFELGRSYEALENKKEAINWYKDALIFDPRYAEAREALTRLGVSKKDMPKTKPGGTF